MIPSAQNPATPGWSWTNEYSLELFTSRLFLRVNIEEGIFSFSFLDDLLWNGSVYPQRLSVQFIERLK